MAVPKGKASKSRTRRRTRINSKVHIPELYRDEQTGAVVRRHHVNLENMMYRGKKIAVQVKKRPVQISPLTQQ